VVEMGAHPHRLPLVRLLFLLGLLVLVAELILRHPLGDLGRGDPVQQFSDRAAELFR
jgi:hypothetical protein